MPKNQKSDIIDKKVPEVSIFPGLVLSVNATNQSSEKIDSEEYRPTDHLPERPGTREQTYAVRNHAELKSSIQVKPNE